MVAPAVEGIDLFKIAGRSISGWVPSFKMGSAAVAEKGGAKRLTAPWDVPGGAHAD